MATKASELGLFGGGLAINDNTLSDNDLIKWDSASSQWNNINVTALVDSAYVSARAGGGQSVLELYSENPSTPTSPVATGGTNSIAIGNSAVTTINGQIGYAAGSFATAGDAQSNLYILKSDTTNTTQEALTTNNSTASTDNQLILQNNSIATFHGTVAARQDAASGTLAAGWVVEGLVRREDSAGTTTLVNSVISILDNTPGWGLTLSADTTNGGLQILVTGDSATNVRWLGSIRTSEVVY